jgi:hypothetical protein
MLGVETIAFKVIPIALFGKGPKDRRECGEPSTDNDMFIETVWRSGTVSTTIRRLVVIPAMATVMRESMEAVLRGNKGAECVDEAM